MAYLPDLPQNGKLYVERDFLFSIVNTVDKNYFREALAEIELRRTAGYGQAGSGLIEIDQNLLGLLEQMQSRMSASKLAASRRTFGSLTTLVKKRKASQRA